MYRINSYTMLHCTGYRVDAGWEDLCYGYVVIIKRDVEAWRVFLETVMALEREGIGVIVESLLECGGKMEDGSVLRGVGMNLMKGIGRNRRFK